MESAGLGVRFGVHVMHPGMAGSSFGGWAGHRERSPTKAGLNTLESAKLKVGNIFVVVFSICISLLTELCIFPGFF